MNKYWDFIIAIITIKLKIACWYHYDINYQFIIVTILITDLIIGLSKLPRYWTESYYKSFYGLINIINIILITASIFHDTIVLTAVYLGRQYLSAIILILMFIILFAIFHRCRNHQSDNQEVNQSNIFINIFGSIMLVFSIIVTIGTVYVLSPLSIIILVVCYIFKNCKSDNSTSDYATNMKCYCGYCDGFFAKKICNMEATRREMENSYGVARGRAEARHRSAGYGCSYDDLG
ncbi:hypothetical protein [Megavirus chiliensis]|uniref:Uncharacterized protein n=2 Tax=Megamimivirinae TaxID=3044648 RepID=A0A2L2DNI4_MIMIV|nr:hypothetical protein MegaChil _gp0894 [Megavirus chiliensis]AEQ33189.1 hypothetical protein [Megavirus chiliensis]AVG47728.1 hypothetical protein [Acanthamoeba polyphaga mimivirus]